MFPANVVSAASHVLFQAESSGFAHAAGSTVAAPAAIAVFKNARRSTRLIKVFSFPSGAEIRSEESKMLCRQDFKIKRTTSDGA
jgi:hypothetical protein